MTNNQGTDLTEPLLALPRSVKRLIVVTLDVILCIFATWLAFFLRLDESVRLYGEVFWRADWASLISIALALPVFITHGFYRVIFRHASLVAIHLVARAFVLYAVAYVTIVTIIGIPGIPRTVGIMQPILLMIGVGLSRAVAHYWLGGAYRAILKRSTLPKVLIYGAGVAGRQLANAMSNSQEMKVVAFLDDDQRLQGHVVNGLRVYDPEDLASVSTDNGIATVLLAMPSISRHRRNEILAKIKQAKVAVRTLPSVSDLAEGKVTVSDLRELDIEDLLGRDPVPPNETLLKKKHHGQNRLGDWGRWLYWQ